MTAVSQLLFALSKGSSRFSTAIESFFSMFACFFFLKKNGYVIILIQVLKAQELRLLYYQIIAVRKNEIQIMLSGVFCTIQASYIGYQGYPNIYYSLLLLTLSLIKTKNLRFVSTFLLGERRVVLLHSPKAKISILLILCFGFSYLFISPVFHDSGQCLLQPTPMREGEHTESSVPLCVIHVCSEHIFRYGRTV